MTRYRFNSSHVDRSLLNCCGKSERSSNVFAEIPTFTAPQCCQSFLLVNRSLRSERLPAGFTHCGRNTVPSLAEGYENRILVRRILSGSVAIQPSYRRILANNGSDLRSHQLSV